MMMKELRSQRVGATTTSQHLSRFASFAHRLGVAGLFVGTRVLARHYGRPLVWPTNSVGRGRLVGGVELNLIFSLVDTSKELQGSEPGTALGVRLRRDSDCYLPVAVEGTGAMRASS